MLGVMGDDEPGRTLEALLTASQEQASTCIAIRLNQPAQAARGGYTSGNAARRFRSAPANGELASAYKDRFHALVSRATPGAGVVWPTTGAAWLHVGRMNWRRAARPSRAVLKDPIKGD